VISHFPAAHPDELLYSLCARYGDRVGYRDKGTVSLELFGVEASAATIDLPSRLGYLVENLPTGHLLHVDRLIDERTLLPFYSPFLKKSNVDRLREEMKGAGGGVVHKVSSITPSTIRPPDFLRFCPSCVEADRQQFKGCYWHRLHQVPGVLACPEHKTFLEESEVRARNRSNSYSYIPAEQANLCADAKLLDLSDAHHRCLMFISQSAQWLLNQRGLVPGYDTLHGYYLQALDAKGLAHKGRFVHAAGLAEALRQVYPQSFLTAVQCDFDDNKEYSWPFRLIKEFRIGKANHPLRHLLLMGLLGHTVKSFFRAGDADGKETGLFVPETASTYAPAPRRMKRKAISVQNSSSPASSEEAGGAGASRQIRKLFGTGPWPCLNITCHFYRQLVIASCRLVKHWERRVFDVGVFSCACGFTYRRKGRKRSLGNQFRFDTIKEYGGSWKERLRELWSDLSLSIHLMAPLLGVAHNTVKYQAVLLGLEFPRKGPGSKIAQAEIKRYKHKSTKRRVEGYPAWKLLMRDRYRKELLKVIKKNPSATRSIINKQLAPRAYRWLYTNDKEWLDAHQPPPYKRVGSNRKVDWVTRDRRLVREVRQAAARIKGVGGRPVRVTVARIGRSLDKTALLQNRKLSSKIPLTSQALSELVEPHTDFAIRCVRWAASCYRREGIVPSISALAKRAGMTMTTTHRPEIRAVINEELEALRNCGDVSEIKAA
jgi:hypothetical protein